MIIKQIQRNIPEERENKNDSFRVKYNDRKTFDVLKVIVTRITNGERQEFKFCSSELPDKDSIYFTTAVLNNKLKVTWRVLNGTPQLTKQGTASASDGSIPTIQTIRPAGKSAFPPISSDSSRILILGTMPGERSLALQQYYGHAGNYFWKIMYSIFSKPFSKDYEDRKKLLQDNGVALWDVLEYCEGTGSADTSIKNERPNDFGDFYSKHIEVKNVFFSSKKAEAFYDTYIGKKESINYYVLPSPSSANTWKTFEEKVSDWQIILKYL